MSRLTLVALGSRSLFVSIVCTLISMKFWWRFAGAVTYAVNMIIVAANVNVKFTDLRRVVQFFNQASSVAGRAWQEAINAPRDHSGRRKALAVD